LVVEAFFFHDVAPVAGGVAYAEENGFVFSFGFIEGFLVPRVPVYWVVGVLEKVRAFFVNQPVGLVFLFLLQKMNIPASILSLRLLLNCCRGTLFQIYKSGLHLFSRVV
jgi:hypothetical protein